MPPLLLSALLALIPSALPQSAYYQIDSFAGSDPSTDAGIALNATLEDIRGIAIDSASNVFFSDTARHRVFKVSPDGLITVVAGAGKPGYSGDGGPAGLATLNQPYGIAVDPAGNLYIADLGNARVRRVSSDGRIQTVAGGGSIAIPSSGALPADVALKGPRNIALDFTGNLYISDFLDHRVLRLGVDGRLSTFAGNGSPGAAVDSVTALSGSLAYPAGLFIDSSGSLWIADSGNHAIRKIAGGIMTTLRVQSSASFINLPTGICIDPGGNIDVASSGFDQAVRVTPSGVVQVLAAGARDIAADNAGNLYFGSGAFVHKLSAGGQLATLAGVTGQFRGEGTSASQALLYAPSDVKLDRSGSLIIADTWNQRIRRVSGGIITTIAGDGESGYRGDGAAATSARVASPQGVAVDAAGNVYVADTGNHRIRRITPDGQIATVAGTGAAGFNGEIGDPLQIQLNAPSAVAIDSGGQLHISDTGNHRIRRLMTNSFLVSIAGSSQGFGGDGLGGLLGRLDTPKGIAFDTEGNLYIADSGNHRIRKLAANGVITTFAGNGQAAFRGDGKAAGEASFNTPVAVAVDAGVLYISDTGNLRIRSIGTDGIVQTIAGTGEHGSSGDQGPALSARLEEPAGLTVDSSGSIYVADRLNHRIRKLTRQTTPPAPPAPPASVVEPRPQIRVSHGATLETTAIAPGMLVSIQGPNLGPSTAMSGTVGATGALDTTVADTQVRFDGRAAPILYAQENLINVQVPYRLSGQTSSLVEVFRSGQSRGQATVNVVPYAPGVFTFGGGSGPAAAVNEDFKVNSTGNAASRNTVVTLYATGEGLTDPPSLDGKPAETPYPVPLAQAQVTIGGQAAEILSLASGVTSPGVLQVSVRVPPQIPTGAQPLVLTIGGVQSQRNVTLFVR